MVDALLFVFMRLSDHHCKGYTRYDNTIIKTKWDIKCERTNETYVQCLNQWFAASPTPSGRVDYVWAWEVEKIELSLKFIMLQRGF